MAKYLDKGAAVYGYNHPNWEKYCDSLIAACPTIAVAYREKAIPYLKKGDYATAFPLEDKAVALDPKTWTAYRGFLKCIFTKDYAGALLDFQQARRLVPGGYEMDHTYPFYEGLCNLELGHYAQAAASFRLDIAQQTQGHPQRPPHFNSLFYAGVLYYEMQDYPQATHYLTYCLRLNPQFPDAHYYLAQVYLARKKNGEATRHLRLGQAYYRQGYRLNEDNEAYANYPHQITLYELETLLQAQTVTGR
ncbi:tetratricopeptide repeat protein [Hymenobacter aquaticus]|uniref:tetratricopeptide repeat protein n=1 Tax=Hymenobacter aquaticus TaxID=1867101 RepID=UPI001436C0E5|nr:tetratricopeptide repeat protein [Hymenobacter aquaticus]